MVLQERDSDDDDMLKDDTIRVLFRAFYFMRALVGCVTNMLWLL